MARPHPHPRARSRFAAQRAGAGRCQHAARRQLDGRPVGFLAGNMAEAARRFEMVADASPDQASSWTLSAGSFWAARANLLAGNPQKFAPYLKRAALHGRTFHGLIAQKALGMKHRARLERAGDRSQARRHPEERPRRQARAGAAAARRGDRRRARAVRAPRSTPIRNMSRRCWRWPRRRSCRACRCGSAMPTGTSATTSRAMTARCIRCRRGSRPAASRSTGRWSGASCARNRRSIPRRAPMSAPWG